MAKEAVPGSEKILTIDFGHHWPDKKNSGKTKPEVRKVVPIDLERTHGFPSTSGALIRNPR